jgi:hypothetical protein
LISPFSPLFTSFNNLFNGPFNDLFNGLFLQILQLRRPRSVFHNDKSPARAAALSSKDR